MRGLSPLIFAALIAWGLPGAISAEEKPAPSTDDDVEAISLLGQELESPKLRRKFRAKQRKLLQRAVEDLAGRPDDPEALIWVGRRTAYLGRYREAIDIYSRGIEVHPEHAALRRHRGHRYITVRRFDDAIADLERATELIAGTEDEIEPDGLPNARNIPTSTLHSNIWYHLGLAYYLKGDLWNAKTAYERCLEVSNNPDMVSATTHWLYMTTRRLKRHRHAKWALRTIHADMDIIENHDYHRLLMVYKGEADAEELLAEARRSGGVGFATVGYGLGNFYLVEGQEDRARELFAEVEGGESWAAFGHLAAEAELARWRKGP
ncbi:MAG: tetratricopeptide repeat protein [Acidobacteriota bacterium]